MTPKQCEIWAFVVQLFTRSHGTSSRWHERCERFPGVRRGPRVCGKPRRRVFKCYPLFMFQLSRVPRTRRAEMSHLMLACFMKREDSTGTWTPELDIERAKVESMGCHG